MPTVLLVRHGVTDATGSRLGGHTDASLNAQGQQQVERVAEELSRHPVAAVYTSPIVRTRETAAIIARPHDLAPREAPGLVEVDYGHWTDRPLAELRDEPLWATIQRAPSRVTFPGGGTIRDMQAAAVGAVEAIAADHGDDAVVVAVSHADVIKAVLAHHLGTSLDNFQRLAVSAASVSVIALPAGRPGMVLGMNVLGHVALPSPPEESGDDDG